MKFVFEFNWRMFIVGAAYYDGLRCVEFFVGPIVIAIWWKLPR